MLSKRDKKIIEYIKDIKLELIALMDDYENIDLAFYNTLKSIDMSIYEIEHLIEEEGGNNGKDI